MLPEITPEQRAAVRGGLTAQFTAKGEALGPPLEGVGVAALGVSKRDPESAALAAQRLEEQLFALVGQDDAKGPMAATLYAGEIQWDTHRDMMGLFRETPGTCGPRCFALLFIWDGPTKERLQDAWQRRRDGISEELGHAARAGAANQSVWVSVELPELVAQAKHVVPHAA